TPSVKYSSDLKDGDKLATVQGGVLNVKITDGSVTINGVKVVIANVLTSNGVVHVVEGVLIPEQPTNPTSPVNEAKPTNNPATSTSPTNVVKPTNNSPNSASTLNSLGLSGITLALFLL
ncbi:hypothetical protein K7432_017492, partial [Basidiobolus ranarum]